MRETQDLYAVLGVPSGAAPETIRAAYRRLAREYHPDHNTSPNATEQMACLNAAYAVLREPGRRAAYDRLRSPRPAEAAGGAPGALPRHQGQEGYAVVRRDAPASGVEIASAQAQRGESPVVFWVLAGLSALVMVASAVVLVHGLRS